jgi:hypothetical protein
MARIDPGILSSKYLHALIFRAREQITMEVREVWEAYPTDQEPPPQS